MKRDKCKDYDSISQTPNYKDMEYSKIAETFTKKFKIPLEDVSKIMFFMVGWTLDNKENLKKMMRI